MVRVKLRAYAIFIDFSGFGEVLNPEVGLGFIFNLSTWT
jgi:hypothetical protein